MMSIKPSAKIVKFMVHRSGVQALGDGHIVKMYWISLNFILYFQFRGRYYVHNDLFLNSEIPC